MTKMTKIVLMSRYWIIFLFLLGSCSAELTEVTEEYHEDGSPKKVVYFKNFEKNKTLVKEIRYYPNGNKQIEGEYNDMRRQGKWTYWYENGNKWSEGHYKLGVEHGSKTVWYENGEKYYEGKVKDGDRVGIWRFWDENSGLVKEIDYNKK